jgi:hypothetical protein
MSPIVPPGMFDLSDNLIEEALQNPKMVVGVEIRGVRHISDGPDDPQACYEEDEENPEMFSAYLRYAEGHSYVIIDAAPDQIMRLRTETLAYCIVKNWYYEDYTKDAPARSWTPDQGVTVTFTPESSNQGQ